MKNNNIRPSVKAKGLFPLSPWALAFSLFAFVSLLFTQCSDSWSEHYSSSSLEGTLAVEVVASDVASFLQSQKNLGTMTEAYRAAGLWSEMKESKKCTAVVCEDADIDSADRSLMDDPQFARGTLSAFVVPPTSLVDGYGILTLSGKNLWVALGEDGTLLIDEKKITRIVKATNGYVYFVSGIIPVRPSVYEFMQSLGDDYSLFRSWVMDFEETYFDAEASVVAGVDAMGNTVYSDSVMAKRNTLMDRFFEDGLPSWDMRSESYQSTLFVPSNDLLLHAYYSALDSIPRWLNRPATAADSLKFKKWMVTSLFVDRRLKQAEVAPSVDGLLECVGGCIREKDETTDKETFTAYEAAIWKPSVQKVDANHPVSLSNGTAYFLTDYKIPNHVVIWRVKSKFYEVWAALTAQQSGWDASNLVPTEDGYFRWNHWVRPVIEEGQSPFELSVTLPTMLYNVLTAIPDKEAQDGGLPVSVDYDGLLYNAVDRDYGLAVAALPAGEYYLRMGFKHSLRYSISIYFCGADEEFSSENRLVDDMSLIATGSNYHFDRGGAMEGLDFYGSESIGYPEYFDWRWWYDQDPVQYQKASAYDTDGYQVAIVNLKKPGGFKIRIESHDNATLYREAYPDTPVSDNSVRTKNNVYQLMMYHWCLRPTKNNY
ncbi:MAG: hypothetical protein J5814_01645 [Bacteroidaceae bacterium]|nr:hypothetical protein [Bacteroidaceae bacterium]